MDEKGDVELYRFEPGMMGIQFNDSKKSLEEILRLKSLYEL